MIRRKMIAVGCVLALSAAPAFAGEQDKGHKEAGMKSMPKTKLQFSELDANQDKKLTRQELTDKGVDVAGFEQADSNSDGTLNQEEFVAVSEK